MMVIKKTLYRSVKPLLDNVHNNLIYTTTKNL